MYTVNTAIKTLQTFDNEGEALAFAAEAFKTHRYVEVMKVTSVTPWVAESVKIFC